MIKTILLLGLLVLLIPFAMGEINDSIIHAYDFNQTSGQLIDQEGNIDSSSVQVTDRTADGIWKYGWDFERSNNDTVEMSSAPIHNLDALTISCWAKRESSSLSMHIWQGKGTESSQMSFTTDDKVVLYLDGKDIESTDSFEVDNWVHGVITYNGSVIIAYVDGENIGTEPDTGTLDASAGFSFGSTWDGSEHYFDGIIDECYVWDRDLSAQEVSQLYNYGKGSFYPLFITPPVPLNIKCTSCNIPYGDTEPPYESEDATPTFTFDTNNRAWCRIGDEDDSYTSMGSSRDCTSGQGSTEHTCTLTFQDRLENGTDYVYISCRDADNHEYPDSSSGPLEMLLDLTPTLSDDGILDGIVKSRIWPGAIVYDDQQVYVRTAENNQALAIFDNVAVYGNQRWGFNYVNGSEPSIGVFYNLTPVFYTMEKDDTITPTDMAIEVEHFIDETLIS
jgi:hypothetical protein